MTQQSTNKAYHTFVKGIITEAGPLTFPENAALDMENVVLNRDGSQQRRLGMDFESDFVLQDIDIAPLNSVQAFLWENAANNVLNQFACVQAGDKLMVFNASEVSLSANLLATIDLVPYGISGDQRLSAASGMGYLFLNSPSARPVYLSYNPSSGVISVVQYSLFIRDIFGVNDGLAVEAQPGSLSTEHHYNLLNQGWSTTNITAYQAAISAYPSNAQQWFVGKDSNEDFQPALLNKQYFGSTPAPKGRYTIDAFDRSAYRDSRSGLTTPSDVETGRPSAVAFAFERLFHAGIRSSVTEASATRPNMTGFVFYSRTLRDARDFSQYHTDADPTSEIDSELVDTDGGFVNIPNSGPIYKMIQKDTGVVIFAENGIWLLEGDEGGFRATANKVTKVSDFGALGPASIVDVEEAILYWNKGGIYILQIDPDTGRLASKNLSEDTIQTFYNSIDKVSKRNAVGTFDPVNRRVMWMYNDEVGYTGTSFRNKYNKELVLDMVLGAFYKHSISSYLEPSPYISGYVPTPDFLLRQEGERSRGDTVTKYLTVQFINPLIDEASVSFAYYRNLEFRDWKSLDGEGVSFLSYIITGYEIMGDSARNKQAPYIVTHFLRTELEAEFNEDDEMVAINPSGCLMQAQWEWADHPNSGKWGEVQQVYRPQIPYVLPDVPGPIDYGFKMITNKTRVRGSGKALSLYFTSDEDKDFYLYGWNTSFTGSPNV